MEQLDSLIIIGAILASTSVFLLLALIIRRVMLAKQLKKLTATKSKSRKKRRRQRHVIEENQRAASGITKLLVVVSLVGIISGLGAGFAYYYQQTNLSTADQENLNESLLYVGEVKSILGTIDDNDNDEKKQATIRDMASHMSGMSYKRGDTRAPSDIQLILNRYYREVGQLGINLANETVEHLKNDADLVANYQSDIERIEKLEAQIYEFYGIKKTAE